MAAMFLLMFRTQAESENATFLQRLPSFKQLRYVMFLANLLVVGGKLLRRSRFPPTRAHTTTITSTRPITNRNTH